MPRQGVAQGMLQVLGMWNGTDHEELQGIQQAAILYRPLSTDQSHGCRRYT